MTGAVAMALAAGFFGGFGHCIGMCGPLVASLAAVHVRGPGGGALAAAPGAAGAPAIAWRSLGAQLAYHAGRLTTYAVLGGVLGLTGSFVNLAGRLTGLTQAVAVIAGVLMILLGLGEAGLTTALKGLEARVSARLMAAIRGVVGGGPGRLYPAGLAFGFLPCGLSWTMLLGAAGTGNLVEGFLVALAFGAGTVPALLAAGAAGAWLGVKGRGILFRIGGLLMAAMGALFVWRGLGM